MVVDQQRLGVPQQLVATWYDSQRAFFLRADGGFGEQSRPSLPAFFRLDGTKRSY